MAFALTEKIDAMQHHRLPHCEMQIPDRETRLDQMAAALSQRL
jgi:hypothetical protein